MVNIIESVSAGSTSLGISTTQPGDLIIVIAYNRGGAISISDTARLTWNLRVNYTGGNSYTVYEWYAVAPTPISTTIKLNTAQLSGSTAFAVSGVKSYLFDWGPFGPPAYQQTGVTVSTSSYATLVFAFDLNLPGSQNLGILEYVLNFTRVNINAGGFGFVPVIDVIALQSATQGIVTKGIPLTRTFGATPVFKLLYNTLPILPISFSAPLLVFGVPNVKVPFPTKTIAAKGFTKAPIFGSPKLTFPNPTRTIAVKGISKPPVFGTGKKVIIPPLLKINPKGLALKPIFGKTLVQRNVLFINATGAPLIVRFGKPILTEIFPIIPKAIQRKIAFGIPTLKDLEYGISASQAILKILIQVSPDAMGVTNALTSQTIAEILSLNVGGIPQNHVRISGTVIDLLIKDIQAGVDLGSFHTHCSQIVNELLILDSANSPMHVKSSQNIVETLLKDIDRSHYHIRNSQIVKELLVFDKHKSLFNIRSTQSIKELLIVNPDLSHFHNRIAQNVIELLIVGGGTTKDHTRINQSIVELLVLDIDLSSFHSYISQAVVELLVVNADLSMYHNFVSQIVIEHLFSDAIFDSHVRITQTISEFLLRDISLAAFHNYATQSVHEILISDQYMLNEHQYASQSVVECLVADSSTIPIPVPTVIGQNFVTVS